MTLRWALVAIAAGCRIGLLVAVWHGSRTALVVLLGLLLVAVEPLPPLPRRFGITLGSVSDETRARLAGEE